MASVKFRLRSKSNKNVSIKIYLSAGRQNKLLEISTGFSINPKDWSESTNFPKQNNPENKILSNELKKLETFVFNNLNKDLSKGILIDLFWLQNKVDECFKRTKKNDLGIVTNHIQYIIDNANTRKVQGKKTLGISKNSIIGYTTFKNNFLSYESEIKKQINFLDVNKTFVDKYINWLINTKKYSVNYSGKMIDNLKTVCIDAEKSEIPVNVYAKQISGFSECDSDRYIVTLSFDELEQIKDTEIESTALQNARNWILIGCEIGQRGSDLLNITNKNIRYDKGNLYLDIIQQKTNKSVTIGIIATHVIEIIENNLPYKISSQKFNEHIKEVCKVCGIDVVIEGKKLNPETKRKELGKYPKHELIASHSFRRSFATNYYKKVPTAILINITGHSKESLFLQYINQREDKDANADMFMQFYTDIHKEKEPQLKVIRTAN